MPQSPRERAAQDRRAQAHGERRPHHAVDRVARFRQSAYDELVRMEEALLSQLEARLPNLSRAARREVELTNLPMINEHLQTFRYRRAHWSERVESLNGQRSRRA
ncbi:MAG: hypothetical protein ACYDB4_15070 [Candidatus Dormibacteraceae bacterium]